MELKDVLAALRAGWWLPVIGLVMGGVAALVVSFLTVPVYTSHTQLFVSTTDTTSTSDVFQGSQFSQQRVTSYAKLVTGDGLLGRVIQQLHLNMTTDQLAREVSATAVTQTVLLDVTVTDPDPRRAQAIAVAIGRQFSAMVAQLETPDGAAVSPVKVTVVDQPKVPAKPSEPNTVRNIVLGLAVGVLLGGVLAVLRAKLDRTVRLPEEAAALAEVPVIGTILRDEALVRGHVIERGSMSRTAEDYRQLRTNLQFLNVDQPPKVIMISSALPAEGKTTMAINLGVALAEAGRRVVIVEADLRRPRVTRYLGMVAGAGLTNVLSGEADLEEVTQSYREPELSVIAAGPIPPNPGELLASGHMAMLLDKLRGTNDYVLIDAPPLLPVADSTGLAVAVDGVLLAVRYGTTRKDQLRQVAATLDRVGAKKLGLVLNMVPPNAEVASAYGYGYAYEPETAQPRG